MAAQRCRAKTVDVLIRIALILFFSAIGWTVLASLIENRLASDIHGRPLPSARARTLLTLFRNALAVVISTITVMILLSEIGVNIAPLLAGAGALGLAISFGAQTLVKDIITGIFIQFENGMNTGDLVTIGPLTGTVERMSIRSVGVRQDTGAYHIIPGPRSPPLPTSCAALARLWLTMTLTAMRIWIKPARR